MSLRYVSLLVVAGMVGFILLGKGETPSEAHNGLCNPPWDRPDGMLIKPEGSPNIYLIEDCGKRLIQDPIDLNTHSFNSLAIVVSAEEGASYQPGPVLRAREGTVLQLKVEPFTKYIIDNHNDPNYAHLWYKREITTSAWNNMFAPCGAYPVTLVSQEYLDTYNNGAQVTNSRPDGQIIKASGSSTHYLLQASAKRRFTSPTERFTYSFPQPACTATTTVYPDGPDIRAREGTRFLVSGGGSQQYVVERNGTSYFRRAILSLDSLNFYGLATHVQWTFSSSEASGYGQPVNDHVHPVKGLTNRVWNKSLVSYDLGVNVQYLGAPFGSWDTAIGLAEAAWNSAAIAPDFWNDTSPPADVVIEIGPVPFQLWAGETAFNPTSGAIGSSTVRINTNVQSTQHQGLIAHELGHVLLLEHDGLNPDGPDPDTLPDGDYDCGSSGSNPTPVHPVPTRVPTTVMDYDCYLNFGVSGPTNWDACGINHKHPTGAWSGC